MQAYIFNSLAAAQAAVADNDAPLSLPWPGTDVGPGQHAPAAQSKTTTYAAIYQRPDGLAWCMLADSWTGPHASIHAASAIPTSIDFTIAPWLGATQVWP